MLTQLVTKTMSDHNLCTRYQVQGTRYKVLSTRCLVQRAKYIVQVYVRAYVHIAHVTNAVRAVQTVDRNVHPYVHTLLTCVAYCPRKKEAPPALDFASTMSAPSGFFGAPVVAEPQGKRKTEVETADRGGDRVQYGMVRYDTVAGSIAIQPKKASIASAM